MTIIVYFYYTVCIHVHANGDIQYCIIYTLWPGSTLFDSPSHSMPLPDIPTLVSISSTCANSNSSGITSVSLKTVRKSTVEILLQWHKTFTVQCHTITMEGMFCRPKTPSGTWLFMVAHGMSNRIDEHLRGCIKGTSHKAEGWGLYHQ